MQTIEVTRDGRNRFRILVIDDDGSTTEHDVTVSSDDLDRLGSGYATAEDFIRACFRFLLAREPKGSILRSFDVAQISTYFPGFEGAIVRTRERG
jgi:hypothetical protein